MLNIYTIDRPGCSLHLAYEHKHVCLLMSALIGIKLKPLHKAQSQSVKHNLMVPDVPSSADVHGSLQKNGFQCVENSVLLK